MTVPAEVAVEEMLRYDSALQLFERTATADVELADIKVATGEKVAVLLGAANRDPSVFDEADALDVGRDPNPHLAFGAGVHFCLGGPLARVELAESLRLLRRGVPPAGARRDTAAPSDLRAARLPVGARDRYPHASITCHPMRECAGHD